MQTRIISCGEAFDQEYGNNSCVLSGQGLPFVLFDCGYQVPERLWRLPLYQNISVIFFSHMHADHCFGLVPLVARYKEERRKEPLLIAGPEGIERFLRQLMELGYGGYLSQLGFPLSFFEFQPGQRFSFEGVTVDSAQSLHSARNLSYRVTDHEGRSVGISGDGAMNRQTAELFEGVNLLLHECFSLKSNVVPVHMNFEELYEYAQGQGKDIEQIGLTHTSRFFRQELRAALLRTNDPRFFIAEPGLVLNVGAEVDARLVS